MKHHPPPTLNHRGRPQWNGSVAQAILQCDIAQGKHKGKGARKALCNASDRAGCRRALSPKSFRWKLQQEERTEKCLYTLKCKAEIKLKDNIDKMQKSASRKHVEERTKKPIE